MQGSITLSRYLWRSGKASASERQKQMECYSWLNKSQTHNRFGDILSRIQFGSFYRAHKPKYVPRYTSLYHTGNCFITWVSFCLSSWKYEDRWRMYRNKMLSKVLEFEINGFLGFANRLILKKEPNVSETVYFSETLCSLRNIRRQAKARSSVIPCATHHRQTSIEYLRIMEDPAREYAPKQFL
jgi:hypothetical protein